jgi:hypothetical protein
MKTPSPPNANLLTRRGALKTAAILGALSCQAGETSRVLVTLHPEQPGVVIPSDVAGEKVKPVQGADGSRVPLLRAGFRPDGPYTVSFVFLHAGTPFAKRGGSELALPRMDVPVGLLQWEVFLPEQYKVKDFGGDAIAASLLPVSQPEDREFPGLRVSDVSI